MVKIGEKPHHFKPVELLVVEGIARRAEDIFFLEVAADLVRAVDWDGRLVEEVQKPLFKRGTVGLDAEGLEDAVPAKFKKLLRRELAALDHEPEAVIDARERRVSGIVIGETPFGKADAHGLLGAFAEVEQRVVDIHQNCLEHEK